MIFLSLSCPCIPFKVHVQIKRVYGTHDLLVVLFGDFVTVPDPNEVEQVVHVEELRQGRVAEVRAGVYGNATQLLHGVLLYRYI